MSKKGLELTLCLLFIVCLIFLVLMICFPEEKFSLLIENLDNSIYKVRRRSRSGIFQIGEDNVVLMYKTVINGLIFISCTCLICLSYLVSKK